MDVSKCVRGSVMDSDEVCLAAWHPEGKCMHGRVIRNPYPDFILKALCFCGHLYVAHAGEAKNHKCGGCECPKFISQWLTNTQHERITIGDHYE